MKDQHVVITGATRGVGKAIAAEFCKAGARVSVFARTISDLENLKKEISSKITVYAGDVGRHDDLATALNNFRQASGPITTLVNNAGIGQYKPFHEMDLPEIEQTIATNFTGLVLLTRAVVEEMRRQGHGHIINIASDLARRPLANMAVYAATKHAVAGFSHSLARELRGQGIRCSLVNPGIIDTYFAGRSPGDLNANASLTSENVAKAVMFLAQQPPGVLIDELSIHNLGQDF